jgi:small-conductance mechanosensitive channel
MLKNYEDEKSLNTLIEEIKPELLGYINRRVRLFKLDAFEKISISASGLGYILIILLIVAVILFFLLTGMAFFIGELLDSLAAGFGIMALSSLLVLSIVILCRKKIKQSILYSTIRFIRKIEDDEQ